MTHENNSILKNVNTNFIFHINIILYLNMLVNAYFPELKITIQPKYLVCHFERSGKSISIYYIRKIPHFARNGTSLE
jgi:hypothetical protein